MTIEYLIDALGKATGPDRELDTQIWIQITPGATRRTQHIVSRTGAWAPYDIDETRDATGALVIVPGFTASLDASVALLGWAEFEMTNLYGVARVTVHNQGDYGPSYGNDECGNIPIAICIAALRSLHQEKNADDK